MWFSDADTSKISGYNGKWLVITYPYNTGDNTTIINKKKLEGANTKADGCYTVDDATFMSSLNAPISRDNFTYYAVTYANFSAATTLSFTAITDDQSSLYVNDTLIKNFASCANTAISLSFNKGWNKIEFILNEKGGENYTRLTPYLTKATNCLGIDCSQVGTIPAKYSSYYIGDDILNFTKYTWK